MHYYFFHYILPVIVGGMLLAALVLAILGLVYFFADRNTTRKLYRNYNEKRLKPLGCYNEDDIRAHYHCYVDPAIADDNDSTRKRGEK